MRNLLLYLTIISLNVFSQNVGINATGVQPDASAGLDINFTDKGLLIPRVNITNLSNSPAIISAPATSLLIYNTNTTTGPGYFFWNGSSWIKLFDSNDNKTWKTDGNSSTTAGTDFIGTIDAQDFVFKTNNTERLRIKSDGKIGIGTASPVSNLEIEATGPIIAIDNTNPAYYSAIFTQENGTSTGFFGQWGSSNATNAGAIQFHNYLNKDILFSIDAGTFTPLVAIKPSGNVGIGTSSPIQRLHVIDGSFSHMRFGEELGQAAVLNIIANTTTAYPVLSLANANISYQMRVGAGVSNYDNFYIWDGPASSSRFTILGPSAGYYTGYIGINTNNPTSLLTVNGTASKTGGGYWATFSDVRLKKDITDYTEGIELLKKLHIVSFRYNEKYLKLFGNNKEVENGKIYQGVIAQELLKFSPDMVTEVVVKGEKLYKVDLSKLNFTLINAVVSQDEKIEQLEKEINILKKEIEQLKNN